MLALGVISAATVAVFVLPIGTWRDQDTDLVQRQTQLDELNRVNAELEAEVNRLGTDDGIREAARQDYGYVEQGEDRKSILPFPELSTDLPDGWPYNAVTQIMNATAAGPRPAPVADDTTAD